MRVLGPHARSYFPSECPPHRVLMMSELCSAMPNICRITVIKNRVGEGKGFPFWLLSDIFSVCAVSENPMTQ